MAEPNDQGYIEQPYTLVTGKSQLLLKQCDPFTEHVDIMVNYTWDVTGKSFLSGAYSKYFEAD